MVEASDSHSVVITQPKSGGNIRMFVSFFFFSSRRRHTRLQGDWSSDVCSSDLFALNWFAVGDHAAYWVALEKGYYKSRGLDVELQNSKGSGDSLAKVDTNRADVGLADAAVVIPRIAQGARVRIVGAVFDHSPLNFWMWTSSGITRPKDLEGKTLAAPPGDAQIGRASCRER